MCAHRQHRTGNCRECDAERPRHAEAPAASDMPQVWGDDGDDG